MTENER